MHQFTAKWHPRMEMETNINIVLSASTEPTLKIMKMAEHPTSAISNTSVKDRKVIEDFLLDYEKQEEKKRLITLGLDSNRRYLAIRTFMTRRAKQVREMNPDDFRVCLDELRGKQLGIIYQYELKLNVDSLRGLSPIDRCRRLNDIMTKRELELKEMSLGDLIDLVKRHSQKEKEKEDYEKRWQERMRVENELRETRRLNEISKKKEEEREAQLRLARQKEDELGYAQMEEARRTENEEVRIKLEGISLKAESELTSADKLSIAAHECMREQMARIQAEDDDLERRKNVYFGRVGGVRFM